MHFHFRRGALGAAILTVGAAAWAQSTTPGSVSLKEVTITANPLGSTDGVAPAAALSGTNLLLKSQGTLGETLSGTPGVSSTYFGPNASRPTIRGMDGDRIRVLSNSGASVDASGVSYDHAVAMDPISIDRLEVVRGPGALMYGGSAVGGVVNVIDNRIPSQPFVGIGGRADLGLASANRERGGGLSLDGGTARIGLHVDVFDRRTSDVSVPVNLPCTEGGVARTQGRICNSASRVQGGAAGGSLFFDQGYLGLSASTYRNAYGTVAEDDVTIRMRSNRYALEGEWRHPAPGLRSIKLQASHTDYTHTEFEAAAPGTVFGNVGNDFRLQARHEPVAGFEGVIGFQGERTRFSADGAEAFAPHSRTRQSAAFVFEELPTSWGKLSVGVRGEQVDVDSLGNSLAPRFAPMTRRFSPASYAAGASWNLAPDWQVASNLASTRRAPKDYELYANGPHVATAAWELGDPTLGVERSTNIDLGVQYKRGPRSLKLNAFASRFANYIGLQSTGATHDVGGDALPEFAYRAMPARFRGFEAQGTTRLHEGRSLVDLEMRADLVRATRTDTGEALPRIAPWRAGATLNWSRDDWGARVGFDHFAAQGRVPAGDRPTAAYILWTAALTYRMGLGASNLVWFARLDNATDRLAYSATSILTQTAPGKAPLPGRSLKVGVQATF